MTTLRGIAFLAAGPAIERSRKVEMMSPTVQVIGIIALLAAAYFYDEWAWRMRPRDKLIEMIRAANWRLHPKAMAELRRRGEDLIAFLPRFLPLLAAMDKTERVAAELVIRKCYPEVAQQLKSCGYSPIADAATCLDRIGPLLRQHAAHADA